MIENTGTMVLNPSMADFSSIAPVFEYAHDKGKGASVIGGYVYHPAPWVDTCLSGKYLFADYYNVLFAGELGQNKTVEPVRQSWGCAKDSPLACGAALHDVATFGQGVNGHLYISASTGMFRLADPVRCGLTECTKIQ
jgi:hypothetical protein